MTGTDNNLIHMYIQELNASLKDKSVSAGVNDVFSQIFKLEEAFAKRLRTSASGRRVYFELISKIIKAEGGIKTARPFFRERQDAFLDTVNIAIRKNQPKALYGVPINYKFCCFAKKVLGDSDARLNDMFLQMTALRDQIVYKHLHLAINKAKIFDRNLHSRATDFSDMIQIANEALLLAVDKYVIDENSSEFYQMATGKILAHLIAGGITTSAATLTQPAQKKLYQIKRVMQKSPAMRANEISSILNIAEREIDEILGATSYHSLDQTVGDTEVRLLDAIAAPKESPYNAEHMVEQVDLLRSIGKYFGVLSVLEQKILLLKGIKIDANR